MPTSPTPQAHSSAQELIDKADQILMHIERMDRRDKLRTWGGFIRSLIAIIPVLIVVWSSWYFYKHGAEIMQKLVEQSAQSAAKYSQQQSQDFLDKMKNMIPGR